MTYVVPPDVRQLTAQMLNQSPAGMSPCRHQPGMQPVGQVPVSHGPEIPKKTPPARLYSSGAYYLR